MGTQMTCYDKKSLLHGEIQKKLLDLLQKSYYYICRHWLLQYLNCTAICRVNNNMQVKYMCNVIYRDTNETCEV